VQVSSDPIKDLFSLMSSLGTLAITLIFVVAAFKISGILRELRAMRSESREFLEWHKEELRVHTRLLAELANQQTMEPTQEL
jgi:hypothetical protein